MRASKIAGVLTILHLCFVTACFSGGKGRLLTDLESGKEQTIVAYGTSLTFHGAWVKNLQAALDEKFPGKAKVINSGKSGESSRWGLENLDAYVISKSPDMVFIEFAINDAYQSYAISVAQARTNLENMIRRVLANNSECKVVLMTMNPPVGIQLNCRPDIRAYYQMYRDVAASRKLLLVDTLPHWEKILNKDRALFDTYVPDGIHPTAAADRAIITPCVLSALGLVE